MTTIARLLLVGLVAGLSLAGQAGPPAAVPPTTPVRTVVLAGGLSDQALIGLGSAVASRPGAVLLLDSPTLSPYLRHYLAELKPQRVLAVGKFSENAKELGRRLGVKIDSVTPWSDGPEQPFWSVLFPRIDRVVVCPDSPRSRLIEAACLAGVEGAPLWIVPKGSAKSAQLRKSLSKSKVKKVYLVGEAGSLKVRGSWRVEKLSSANLRHAYLNRLSRHVDRVVVINPHDTAKGKPGTSALAPWLAVRKKAALLMTNAQGTNAAEVVEHAARRAPLTRLDAVILLADLRAIPTRQRPNPIPGDKDKLIEMEPLTPPLGQAFSYAIGRLFHEDLAVVPLMQARQGLMEQKKGPCRAFIASNPGGSLPLLETFSRHTSRELRNAGWDVTALYGDSVKPEVLRKGMVGADLFLWEGHHNTLVKEWGFTKWDEAMPPSFVFLQSCLALMPEKTGPLLARGAVGVLGTSTRTYSGSGGAFSLSFLDGCVYEGRSLGDSLRQAKNFLVCYARLKKQRLASQAVRTGANYRASWAFTLWGDPTFRLPLPARRSDALPHVRPMVSGNTITLKVPARAHPKLTTSKYRVELPANARMAGLLRREDDDRQPLVPFLFAEVHLPRARGDLTPKLRTRLPASQWVFLWDGRRKRGYLLVRIPRHATGDVRFRVEWPGPSVVGRELPAEGERETSISR